MDKKQAWDYAIGMVKVDGLTPTEDFINLANKEIEGKITTADIEKTLNKKYKMKK